MTLSFFFFFLRVHRGEVNLLTLGWRKCRRAKGARRGGLVTGLVAERPLSPSAHLFLCCGAEKLYISTECCAMAMYRRVYLSSHRPAFEDHGTHVLRHTNEPETAQRWPVAALSSPLSAWAPKRGCAKAIVRTERCQSRISPGGGLGSSARPHPPRPPSSSFNHSSQPSTSTRRSCRPVSPPPLTLRKGCL